MQTVRDFLRTEIPFLDDANIAGAAQFLVSQPSTHSQLMHFHREDPVLTALEPAPNMVYAKCLQYIRATITPTGDDEESKKKAREISRSPLKDLKVKQLERLVGYEFSANFVAAFKAVAYLEELALANDAAFDERLQQAEDKKNRILNTPIPW